MYTIVNGVKLIDSNDMVVKSYKERGYFEPETFAAWKRHLDPNKAAIDVGSYSGMYAMYAAINGISSYAFECNPYMIERIQKNVELNGLQHNNRFHLIQAAAGEKSSRMNLSIGWDHTSAGTLTKKPNDNKFRSFMVDVIPVYVEQPVSVVKMDVEGFEIQALKGMMPLIKRDLPAILVEALSEEMETDLNDLLFPLYGDPIKLDSRNLGFGV